MSKNVETLEFQTETKRLLDLVIHSIYSNKEIFLRELISNASDAIDKLKYEQITDKQLSEEKDFEIRLESDTSARTLTIIDNGIGMSREEVVKNIGTIAKSGTKELLDKASGKNANQLNELIGQFGVGFYSAFMVADRIELLTRRAGEEKATKWVSGGDGEFTIVDSERDKHGTSIILHLKPVDQENGIEDYTQFMTLATIVKRYSDFISYPVKMQNEKEEPQLDDEGKPIDGKTQKVVEDETLNSMKPIWEKSKSTIKKEEYTEFYKHISHDWGEPSEVIHFSVEGRIEYKALLFIPGKAPFDLYYRDAKVGLQLYTKRVMIMEACEDLLPSYLRFVKGVVESTDLPLNISRELLQQDRHIAAIRKRLVKKILDTLANNQKKEKEKYLEFWKEFGPALKEGLNSDFENKEALSNLLLFQSSADAEKLISLREYVERMPKEQAEIYYITGENRATVENSPHIEAFKAKNYEVLFLLDPVDEIMVQSLVDFDGKKLKSISKGDVELGGEAEKKEQNKTKEAKQEELKDFLGAMQKQLDENIKEVRVSSRLVDSPACLVADEFEMSAHLEKLLQKSGAEASKTKKILEINPDHGLISKLNEKFKSDANAIDDYTNLLLGYAYIAEGVELPDPAKFNKILANLMSEAL